MVHTRPKHPYVINEQPLILNGAELGIKTVDTLIHMLSFYPATSCNIYAAPMNTYGVFFIQHNHKKYCNISATPRIGTLGLGRPKTGQELQCTLVEEVTLKLDSFLHNFWP